MFSRSQPNPVLETKRDALLAEEQESRLSLLAKFKEAVLQTKHVHSSFLFTTENGHFILKSICCVVTSIIPNTFNTSWKDFAAKLGYNDMEIKCIGNLQGPVHDPTEQILQYFAETCDGTVGDILQALLDLGFQPALNQARQYIEGFLVEVEESTKVHGLSVQINTEDGVKDIVKAGNFKPHVPIIFDSVPFKKTVVTTIDTNIIRAAEIETLQTAKPKPKKKQQKKKQYSKIVLLSFATDGQAIAKKMAQVLRATKNNKGHSIGVVILSENEEEILKNPRKVIKIIMSQMDFVIPVLTPGYFRALENTNLQATLLDECYIQFIHDSMVSNFIENQCVNFYVRPLIPQQELNNICKMKEFSMDSIFKPFRTDDEMELLALNILKSRKEKMFV